VRPRRPPRVAVHSERRSRACGYRLGLRAYGPTRVPEAIGNESAGRPARRGLGSVRRGLVQACNQQPLRSRGFLGPRREEFS
jgi:hypothetical protein